MTIDNFKYKFSYKGNLELLKAKKISIVGSRKPSKYSREMIQKISSLLSKYNVCIVSGGAMGIDAIAHNGAGSSSTIAVLPCGINIRYPSVNKNLLIDIEKNGLLLSQFKDDEKPRNYYFVQRNEVVVSLGEVLIVGEADLNSGSMRSIEFALKMKKKIYVLPQRLGESIATNRLVQENKAEFIYDIEEFVSKFAGVNTSELVDKRDEFLLYCSSAPSYDEALAKFPSKIFEAELNGDINIVNGRVILN